MRAKSWFIALLALALVLSCRGPKLIEREEMEQIFYEMLLQDQLVKQNHTLKRQADTSLVYEGIFEAHGYTTDDYLYSLKYYLEEPARMEKVMGNVAQRLDGERKEVRGVLELNRWRERMLAIYAQKPDTSRRPQPPVRPVDTLHVRFAGDSVYLHKEPDSLDLVPKDSLLFVRDSL